MKWVSLSALCLFTASLAGCSGDESDLYGARSGEPTTGGMATGGMATGGIATTGGTLTGGATTGGGATAGGTAAGGTNTGGQLESGGTGGSVPQTGGALTCQQGSETCPCYDDDTCDDPLTCASGLCVDLTGIGGTGGSPSSGGAPAGGAGGNTMGGTTNPGGGGAGGVGIGGDGGLLVAGAGGLAGAGNAGGTETGGAPTGGAPTGGAPTGGAPTGGAPTGGAPTGGAGGNGGAGGTGSGCNTATVDPCSVIPHFTEPQTVDGDDSEFCNLPSFVLDFVDNNAFVQVDHPGSNDPGNERPETATVRLGWSAVGIHAFIAVTDPYRLPPTQLSSIWDGDTVELFFTTDTNLAGDPATDTATHVAVSADPSLAASVSTTDGVASHTALQAPRYETIATADGYAIELRLPWRSSAPTSGAEIAFDLALDSADNEPAGAPDGRDAQAILQLATLSSATTCAGEARPWCDDRTWCTPTLE